MWFHCVQIRLNIKFVSVKFICNKFIFNKLKNRE